LGTLHPEKQCLVCTSNGFESIFQETLLKCKGCGFVTANMEIDPKQLEHIYTENYFKGEEYVDYLRDKEILQTNFKKRLRKIQTLVDPASIRNCLEIGCAYGFFAEELTKTIPNVRYIGYDVVPEAIEYGAKQLGQNIICADYLSAKITEPLTDIFMFDVIEHLPAPHLFIAKATQELESGGRIYITTGDIERFIPRIQKQKWRMIHPPSHLHYFSKKTLCRLLESHGFEIIHVGYPPVYRSIRLIFYSLFMLKKKYPKWIGSIYKRIPTKMNIAINTFDIMFVVARKK
jgi:2-polyprenyl-3-methyl-5-hydroxy-6-metoxy-1,4-benzoquinol methylase